MMPEYRYPNSGSYRMLRSGPGGGTFGAAGTLRKGYLFRVRYNSGSGLPAIDPSRVKVFQYNPSELGFSLTATALDPPDAVGDGGALDQSKFQIGQASTGLELMFSRDQEVYSARNPAVDVPERQGNDFRVLGVQRDLADVYELLLGPEEALRLTGRAMRDISGTLYDFGASGKAIATSPIGVSFNDYLVLYGWVQSMAWSFPKFNNRLVPTMLKINLQLDIMNISSAQQVMSTLDTTSMAGNVAGAVSDVIDRAGGLVSDLVGGTPPPTPVPSRATRRSGGGVFVS